MNTPAHAADFLRRRSFIERNARERANALVDAGTARELLGPFDRIEAPWLAAQGITPVMIPAMHKAAAARITRRSVAELETLARKIAPMSYDIRDYAKLGLLHKLLHPQSPDEPTPEDIAMVQLELLAAIADARSAPFDLRSRLESKEATETRKASRLVYEKLQEQWHEPPEKP